MTDDAVRERHGVACRNTKNESAGVTVWEGEEIVYLDADYNIRALTPWQARYLASKLYRLSRRIRQRKDENDA